MDNALYYLALNRQTGLRRAMDTVANNVANLNTPGFRREQIVFSEFVKRTGAGDSVSMADSGASFASSRPGEVRITNAPLDIAIEGDGFFLTDGQDGPLLSRAGMFQTSPEGLVVTPSGRPLLDDGGGQIFLPPGGGRIDIASDGTLSVDGEPRARIGVYTAAPETLTRIGGTAFRPTDGFEPVLAPSLRQGALEGSNVKPVDEIARMISVSRAYEQAQNMIKDEDDRLRDVIRKLGQAV